MLVVGFFSLVVAENDGNSAAGSLSKGCLAGLMGLWQAMGDATGD